MSYTPDEIQSSSHLSGIPEGDASLSELDDEDILQLSTEDALQMENPTSDTVSIHRLHPDILACLGETTEPVKTFELHPILQGRWNLILANGLDKKERSSLREKYSFPTNLEALKPPKLNPQLFSAIPEAVMKTDNSFSPRQAQLGTGIVALGHALNSILKEDSGHSGRQEGSALCIK